MMRALALSCIAISCIAVPLLLPSLASAAGSTSTTPSPTFATHVEYSDKSIVKDPKRLVEIDNLILAAIGDQQMSDRAFGHGKFTGTVLWIDPANSLYFVLLSNRVHPNGSGNVNRLAGEIAPLAYAAIASTPAR